MPNEDINNSIADFIETMSLDTEGTLKSIDLTLRGISRNGLIISQSSLQDLIAAEQRNQGRTETRPAPNNIYAERRERGRQDSENRQNNQASSNNRNDSSRNRQQNDEYDRVARKKASSFFDSVADSFEDSFKGVLFGGTNPIKKILDESITNLAHKLGTDVAGIGDEVGKRLGESVGQAFKNSKLGGRLTAEWQGIANSLGSRLSGFVDSIGDRLTESAATDIVNEPTPQPPTPERQAEPPAVNPEDIIESNVPNADIPRLNPEDVEVLGRISDVLNHSASETGTQLATLSTDLSDTGSIIDSVGNLLTTSSTESAGALTQLGSVSELTNSSIVEMGSSAVKAAAAFPGLTIALIGAILIIDKLSDVIGPVVESFKGFTKKLSNAANRAESQASYNLKVWQERVKKDQESIVEAAYDVIKDAANKIQTTWDSILTTVSSTQGYNKAGVQDLWTGYAKRLQEEQLSSYISSADVMDNLSSVLKSGLSGAVAEEFAYQATLLNNAIPTEDFFQFAQSYATIAANAIQQGKSEEEAITKATNELQQYASNFLYASRQIAGGFATSLHNNAATLFEESLKIAQTSRTGDVSEISGVLTSVSALVGAIAPDLANSLVDVIVSAATGGNSSELTAIRSMAGTGASNTAFLNAFVKNPEKIFETLFKNLAQLQNMSAQNYMEVAEGLSSVFGVSMDAFARVDFSYLADAISAMNTRSDALDQNFKMLVSGQTTSTESQLRMQKINEYMVDQGLAYVLDNEVARSIQEHMWQEQLAREIEETTFAVDLQGSAMELLNSIAVAIAKLNPFNWFRKAETAALTALEAAAQAREVKDIVRAGTVGAGNKTAFYNLTNNKAEDLKLAKSYLSLLGGKSNLDEIREEIQSLNDKVANEGMFSKMANGITSWLDEKLGATTHISNSGTTHGGVSGKFGSSTNGPSSRSSSTHGGGVPEGTPTPYTGKSAAQALLETQQSGKMAANSAYKRKLVSKSTATSLSSGDFRTDLGYSPVWDAAQEELAPKTQSDAIKLSTKMMSSMSDYITGIYSNAAAKEIENSRATVDGELHRDFLSQNQILDKVSEAMTSGAIEQGSFEDWRTNFEKSLGSNQKLEEVLADYGTDISAIEAIFDAQEAQRNSAAAKAKELHEVQFWEDMQQFATKDFPWYMKEWENYYIKHTAYGGVLEDAYGPEGINSPVKGKTGLQSVLDVASNERSEQGDAILALADALTQNNLWQHESVDALKDPQIQTNALLAKILLIVEAIMHQNNETSVVSVPTSLVSLGLGTTNI